MTSARSCSQCGTSLPADSITHVCVDCASAVAQTIARPDDATGVEETVTTPGNPDATITLGKSTPSAGGDVPETSFGDYEIVRELARGGMGVVFEARQVSLNRPVALKMILSSRLASPDDVQRFYVEAESAAKLEHPGIVPIYEVGEHAGQHFFSMGLVQGGSLKDLVKDGPLSPREAAGIVQAIAEAVQYAHARNIVHRDLKPANVLLDQQGRPKVTDFGLAKDVEQGSGLTATGQVLGTPSYMAPEQAAGKVDEVGPLADVYALGAILYFLLTGRPPFEGKSVVETLQLVVQKQADPTRRLNAAVDLDLDTICLKCLSKEPERRYASAAELADELGRYLRGEPITARPVGQVERSWRWARRNPLIAGLGAAVAVAIIAGTAFSWRFAVEAGEQAILAEDNATEARGLAKKEADARGTAEKLAKQRAEALGQVRAEKAKVESEKAKVQQEKANVQEQLARSEFVTYGFRLREAQLHLEAGRLAEAKKSLDLSDPKLRGWEYQHLLVQTQRLLRTDRRHQSRIYTVAYSPDGKLLAIASSRAVRLWDAGTWRELRTFPGGAGRGNAVCFSPDSRLLATASSGAVNVWNVATGEKRQSFKKSRSLGAAISFSRDGRFIAGADWDGKGGVVKIWDVETGKDVFALKGHSEGVTAVAFSPAENRLASASRDKTVKIWDSESGKLLLTLAAHTGPIVALAYSPDGTRIATASHDRTVRVWDAATGQVLFIYRGALRKAENLVVRRGWIDALAYSPNGRFLAGCSSDGSIRLWDTTGGEALVLTGHQVNATTAAFSPDGRRLVSADAGTAVAANSRVMLWDVTLGRNPRTLTGHTESVYRVVCSPDGSHVASTEFRIRSVEQQAVKVWNASTGKEVVTIKPGWFVRCLAYSPDGKRIAGGGMKSGVDKAGAPVWVWDAVTGKPVFQFQTGTRTIGSVCFSPDGKRIISGGVTISPTTRSYHSEIQVWDAATGRKILTKRTERPVLFSRMCISRDGRYLAVNSLPIKVLDARTFEEFLSIDRPKGEIGELCFSPDGKQLAAAYSRMQGVRGGGVVKVWDVATGKERLTLKGHTSLVIDVAYSADGKRLATAGYEGTVKIWDAVTGQEALTLTGHTDGIYSVAFSPDGRRLVSGSKDQTVKVWDTRRGTARNDQAARTIPGRAGKAHVEAFNSHANRLATRTPNGNTAQVWEASTWKKVLAIEWPKSSGFHSFALSPDGTKIAAAGWGSDPKIQIRSGFGTRAKTWPEVRLWDAGSGKALLTIKPEYARSPSRSPYPESPSANALAFNPDGNRIAIGGGRNSVVVGATTSGETGIYDVQTGKVLFTLKGHKSPVSQVVFSPNGKLIATGGRGTGRSSPFRRANPTLIKIWDAATGTEIRTLTGDAFGITALAFSPDGKLLASAASTTGRGGTQGSVFVWDTNTWQRTATLSGFPDYYRSLVFSPDGKRFAAGGRSVRICSAADGKVIRSIDGPVQFLAFNRDGSQLRGILLDGTAKVWTLAAKL